MTGRPVALVSGATRGIGRAIAVELAKQGFDVAFCFRNASSEAEEVATQIERAGAKCYFAPCNVANFDAVKVFVSDVEKEMGPIAALINNAGIVVDRPLMQMSDEDWQSVIDTNLSSTFYFCRSVIFGFLKRKSGVIVNISSVSGVLGQAGQTNYSASKAGIIGFTRALSREVGPYGIRVNVVAPGFIETDMTKELKPKLMEQMINQTSLRRAGTSQEVADLACFLASDKSSYMTGQVLCLDGGMA